GSGQSWRFLVEWVSDGIEARTAGVRLREAGAQDGGFNASTAAAGRCDAMQSIVDRWCPSSGVATFWWSRVGWGGQSLQPLEQNPLQGGDRGRCRLQVMSGSDVVAAAGWPVRAVQA